MTISTSSSAIQVAGNGVTTSFSFPFVADDAADITVTAIASNGTMTLLSPSQYTLSINAANPNQLWGVGGNIVYPLSGTPLPAGQSLLIQRTLPLTQQTSVQNQGNYYAQVTEQALDTLCMEIQQVAARTGQMRGTWAIGVAYNFGDIVTDGANGNNTTNLYTCANANTSGVWATDLANGDWSLALNIQAINAVIGAFLPLAGGTITGSLIVSGSITGNATATGGTTSSSLAMHFAAFANVVADFGAKADGTTDDSAAIQAAIDYLHTTFNGGTVYFPATANAYYLNSTSLTAYKGIALVGAGKECSTLTCSSSTPPVTMISAGTGASEVEIAYLSIQPRGSGNIGVQIKGTNRAHIHDCYFYAPAVTVGTAIQLDVNSVAGAYNHYVHDNIIQNFNLGIEMKNGNNACVIRENNIISNNAVNVAGSGGANIFIDNLFQSYSAGPTGTGIAYSGTETADQIIGNYFEKFNTAISFNATSASMVAVGNHWDGNNNTIVDSTTNGATKVLIDEGGFCCFGSGSSGTGASFRGAVGVRGNSNTTGAPGYRIYDEYGSQGWDLRVGRNAQGYWSITNSNNSHDVLFGNNDDLHLGGKAIITAAQPFTLTNQTTTVGASTGTLTNCPAVGNPTGYLQFSINGATAKVPYWT